MPEKYVCLSCLHAWTTRSESALERQCSNCRRRTGASLSELEHTVLVVKEWVDARRKYIVPVGPLYFPPAFLSTIELIRKINPEFPYGIEILRKIYAIASEYNPKKETLEDCINRLRDRLR